MSKRLLVVDDNEDNRRILVDGYEATRRIKAQEALRRIPLIAVTSYALGGDDYVAKPYSPRALLAKVRERIGAA